MQHMVRVSQYVLGGKGFRMSTDDEGFIECTR